MNYLYTGETSTAVADMLGTVQSDLMANVTAALPITGGVFAAIAGIFFGIKIFKRVTGARS